jgi:thermostable 8-oxoguanine DNA glycosylase
MSFWQRKKLEALSIEGWRSLRTWEGLEKHYFNFKPFLDAEYKADLFSELCFCLLTANSSASLGIKAQMQIGTEGF